MSTTTTPHQHSQPRFRSGFTLMELLVALAVCGLMTAAVFPRIAGALGRLQTGQAARLVATDLEQAVSLAARQRKPVRIAYDAGTGRINVTDRNTAALLFSRAITGANGGYGVTSVTFSANPVDVYPTGLTSGALTVTVTSATVSRQAIMSTAGFVRAVP